MPASVEETGSGPRTTISRRLLGFLELDVVFENLTGLLIKMPIHAQTYRIGGADHYPMFTLRKYSINGRLVEKEVPLVPGSSLKGRMRGLLELALGKRLYTSDKDRKIWQHVRSIHAMKNFAEFLKDIEERCEIDDLFGWAAANLKQIKEGMKSIGRNEDEALRYFQLLAPTRLLVDDFTPTEEFIRNRFNEFETIADFIEEKSENRIDRVTSAADPRSIARIRPGIEFGGKLKVLIFDIDKEQVRKYLNTLALGMKLVEETYLGGSGSRGYGRIRFKKIRVRLNLIKKIDGVATIESELLDKFDSVNEFLQKVGEIAEKIISKAFVHEQAN